jgi:hypothetical protein
MLGAAPAQAMSVDDSPQACDHEWHGIRDFPRNVDSHRWANLRMAWLVYYCDGDPEFIQTYLAVTCKYDGQPYACSFNWAVSATESGVQFELSGNDNPNTGDDGFASRYGRKREHSRCDTYRAHGEVSDLGIAGVRVPGVILSTDAGAFNDCV